MNNFVLYSSFSLTLTVRGVSNKHCLLTFFIQLSGYGLDDIVESFYKAIFGILYVF